jgi:hypothetical protein
MKRYSLFTHDDGDGFPYTDEEITKEGEWVKYNEAHELLNKIESEVVGHFDAGNISESALEDLMELLTKDNK